MILLKIDDIEFKLREYQDFSWLNNYGTEFPDYIVYADGIMAFSVLLIPESRISPEKM